MSLDGTEDLLVSRVAELLRTHVTAYLAAEVTSPDVAAQRVYEYPVPMTLMPTLDLPALLVWREASREEPQGRHDYTRTTLRIDCILRTTPADRLEVRWPLLHRVFKAVQRAIREDTIPAVVGPPAVALRHPLVGEAGVQWLQENATTVRYDFVTDTGHKNAYPFFLSRFELVHLDTVPGVTTEALDDLSLYGSVDLPDYPQAAEFIVPEEDP